LTSLDSHLSSFGEALLPSLALLLDAPFDYLVTITVPIGEPYSKIGITEPLAEVILGGRGKGWFTSVDTGEAGFYSTKF
jgi:hypothetical protein